MAAAAHQGEHLTLRQRKYLIDRPRYRAIEVTTRPNRLADHQLTTNNLNTLVVVGAANRQPNTLVVLVVKVKIVVVIIIKARRTQ